jgi:6-phosphogluconolactonase
MTLWSNEPRDRTPEAVGLLIKTFDTSGGMARAAAAAVAAALTSLSREKSDRIVLAVSGGSVAKMVLPELAAMRDVPWKCIVVTLVDERWVPVTHPASNQGQVSAQLVGVVGREAMLGLYTGTASPEDALIDLSARIPAPDVVLLGMGEDGHIASLFPHDPANHVAVRFAAVERPDFPRITMTPVTLRSAKHTVLAFDGANKHAVFERARVKGAAEEFPVRHLLADQTQVFASR